MQQLDAESVQRLIGLLNESQVPDNIKQQEIHQQISELSTRPEFCDYIIYILTLTNDPNLETTRRIAGASLKGALERNWNKLSPTTLENIKSTLLSIFFDANPAIRRTVANVISEIFIKLGAQGWPELVKFLEHNLQQNQEEVVECSLECIAKLFEDLKMNSEHINQQSFQNNNPFEGFISKIINICDPNVPLKIRDLALQCLNFFVQFFNNNFLLKYFEILILYSEDQHSSLRHKSCEGFLEILELKKELIVQNLDQVLERILKFTMDDDRKVKKVACRFWGEYLLVEKGESMQRIMYCKKYLQILVPLLMDCLRYIKEESFGVQNSVQNKQYGQSYSESSSDEGEGFDSEGGANTGEWNLRKESARTLDFLARHFKQDTFVSAQEKIAACLKNNDWVTRESGIFCLGVLSKGSHDSITQHFHHLFPFLMESLNQNEHPLIRSSSFWTLSKFTDWIIAHGISNEEILRNYLLKILNAMMEDDSQVCNAACTALAKTATENGQGIENYLADIVEVFKVAVDKYQKNNLANLYDTISAVTVNVAQAKIQDPSVQNTLVSILIKKWNESQFNDLESIYLVECSDAILNALEDHSINYSEFFFTKTLFLIMNYIQARKNDDKKYLEYKKDIALRAFDMFLTFLKVMGVQAEKYMGAGDYKQLFDGCLEDQNIVVKQFVLSSVGQVAKYCPRLVVDHIEHYAQTMMANMVVQNPDDDPESALEFTCNNTAYSIGEFAVAYPNEFSQYITDFALRICDILESGYVIHNNVTINLSIAIGRMGLIKPDVVAPLLDRFLGYFCDSLKKLLWNEEKQQAFRGLFSVIAKNPNGIVQNFMYLCEALVNFDNADSDLKDLAAKLIINFKAIAGDAWFNYFNSFPPELQTKIKQKYAV